VNTLNAAMMREFESVLSRLESDGAVKAAVVTSGKPGAGGFVAGADIDMLAACKTADELAGLSRAGQRLMDRLAASRKPVVAAIDGVCLGGGLELALACTYRVASSSRKTTLGLPEVKLGLLPGA
jgi:enoyl-CoA hydratase / long-chain 3-hydroxyacyl-CoA dehydrogenase